jgi:hypothetical protein
MFAARAALMAGGALPLRTKPTLIDASYSASNNYSQNVTIPAHVSGDIIVIMTISNHSTQAAKPTAGGTVPNWTLITSASTASGVYPKSQLFYATATSSTTTSGSFTVAGGYNIYLMAFVVRNGSATGGNALAFSTATTGNNATITPPAVTLSNLRGDSLLIHGVMAYDSTASPVIYQAGTAGYTYGATFGSVGYSRGALATKNDTTADGSFNYGYVTAGQFGGMCNSFSLEILPVG